MKLSAKKNIRLEEGVGIIHSKGRNWSISECLLAAGKIRDAEKFNTGTETYHYIKNRYKDISRTHETIGVS